MTYAKERVQGGKPIIEHARIREILADMYVNISVARDAVWRAAWHADTAGDGEYDHKEGMRCALFASDMAPQVCIKAMNIFGGNGYMDTHPAERHLRDAMMCYHIDGLNDTTRLKARSSAGGRGLLGRAIGPFCPEKAPFNLSFFYRNTPLIYRITS